MALLMGDIDGYHSKFISTNPRDDIRNTKVFIKRLSGFNKGLVSLQMAKVIVDLFEVI